MRVKLHQVGLKKTPTSRGLNPKLPKIIEGNLKGPVRTRWPIRIEIDNGQLLSTALVRRCGPGWVITDEADYAISYANAVPTLPNLYTGVLENVFVNEAELISRALDLLDDSEELRDTPTTREIGYTEFLSRKLGYELNDCADLAAEGEFATQDAQRVLVAALSAQCAELFHQLHVVDYRRRLVVLPTSHAIRGVDVARREIEALAIFYDGKVIHCLPSELQAPDIEHSAHILALYSLTEKSSGGSKAKRPSNPKAIHDLERRRHEFTPVEEGAA